MSKFNRHQENPVGREFCTADLHFNHGNIMKYCRRPGLSERELELLNAGERFKVGWDSVERMNAYLLDGINNLVGENDTLRIVGDFCWGPKNRREYYNVARRFRSAIACRNVHLTLGNHDDDCIADLFSSVSHRHFIRYNGCLIVFDHYCGAIWRDCHKKSMKAILCYGHSHSTAEKWIDKIIPEHRSMDVGVDNAAKLLGAYRPFAMDEIMAFMSKRLGHSTGDHHGKK